MIKLLGCALILFACVRIAACFCRGLKERVQCLDQLDRLLTVFSGEVRYGLRPLPQVFESLGGQAGGEGFARAAEQMNRRDGRSARDCFYAGAQGAYPALTEEDAAILLALGDGLGTCDGDTQCRQIEAVRERLALQRQTAREAAVKNTRLYQGLGLLGGLFLILLLV